MTTHEQKALELAKELTEPIDGFPRATALEENAAAELRRLAQQEAALKEWFTKTDWVRPTLKPAELGLHIADVLKDRLASVEAELDDALANIDDFAKATQPPTQQAQQASAQPTQPTQAAKPLNGAESETSHQKFWPGSAIEAGRKAEALRLDRSCISAAPSTSGRRHG